MPHKRLLKFTAFALLAGACALVLLLLAMGFTLPARMEARVQALASADAALPPPPERDAALPGLPPPCRPPGSVASRCAPPDA